MKNVGRPLIIEICAGTAILSKCFRDAGFDHLAIDHSKNRFHPYVSICNVDLTKKHGWEFLEHVLSNYNVVFVHAAPPCGTCSRAREIPRPHAPRPLRSEDSPMGLAGLSTTEQARVDAANSIYLGLAQFLLQCTTKNVPWTLENPARSLLWLIPCIVDLQQRTNACFYNYDTCAWGSQRRLQRSLLSTMPAMCGIQALCNNDHDHLPIGRSKQSDGTYKWDTADEAAYTAELCKKIVEIVQTTLKIWPDRSQATPNNVRVNQRGQIALQKQPRGRSMPPILSEFVAQTTVKLPEMPPLDSKGCLLRTVQGVPQFSKLISFEKFGDKEDGKHKFLCKFGIYRTPVAWLRDSCKLVHPFDQYHSLPDAMLEVIFLLLTSSPDAIVNRRAGCLRRWLSWAAEMDDSEKVHKSGLEEGVRVILQPKRLLLLKRIAQDMQWPDMELFAEIDSGFELVGLQEPSGVFDLEPRPQQISEEELWSSAKFVRPALLGKVRHSDVDRDQKELWDITMDETTTNGWMLGPFTVDEMHDRAGGEPWIPVRRFGVWQSSGDKTKLRPIDDYAENKVNTAFGYSDKLDLRTLDQVIWAIAAIVRSLFNRRAEFVLSDGRVLSGPVHPANLSGDQGLPLISVLDLSSAYKQFAISPKCRRMSVIIVRDPGSGECKCFEGRVLPFGATASVVHFNRISRLVQAIGFQCGILWGNYFDDFPMVTTSAVANSSMQTSTTLLDLLGFSYAKHKLSPFSDYASVLGVDLDLRHVKNGQILVRNKPSRVEEVGSAIQLVLDTGKVTSKDASRLAGRLQFADSQIMGRLGRLAMHDFRQCVKGPVGEHQLDQPAIQSLRTLMSRLQSGHPKELPCFSNQPSVVTCTDGASEGSDHTIGGVLVNGDSVEYFSCRVPDALVVEWQAVYKHVIGLVEMYAVLVASSLWSDALTGRRAMYFIDNQSALDALIKGTSSSTHFRTLLERWEHQEAKIGSMCWFARVPSHSNPADEPSRACHSLMRSIGAVRRCKICLPPEGDLARRPLKKKQ